MLSVEEMGYLYGSTARRWNVIGPAVGKLWPV